MVKLKYIITALITVSTPVMAINNAEINTYAGEIKKSIESKMENQERHKGKTCTIRIKIRENGSLIYAKEEGGDRALCKDAMKAVRKAELPVPPSREAYEVFKNAPLYFKP